MVDAQCLVLIMGLMFMLSTHHYWLDIPTHEIKGPTRENYTPRLHTGIGGRMGGPN